MEQFTQAPVALDTQESIDKISEGMTYVVNGNQSIEAATIPVGAYVRLVNSTITGRSDGIYTVKTAIPVAPATIDNTYLQETAPIPGGVANALSSKIKTITETGTTSNGGNFSTSLNRKYPLLAISSDTRINDVAVTCFPYTASNNDYWLVNVHKNDNMALVTGTQISYTIYYLDE